MKPSEEIPSAPLPQRVPKIVYPRPDFERTTERYGVRKRDLAGPGAGESTIHAMLNPRSQKRRKGGVLYKTALAICNNFIANTSVPTISTLTFQEVFELLFQEQRPDTTP